jgi:hypothetical protein
MQFNGPYYLVSWNKSVILALLCCKLTQLIMMVQGRGVGDGLSVTFLFDDFCKKEENVTSSRPSSLDYYLFYWKYLGTN